MFYSVLFYNFKCKVYEYNKIIDGKMSIKKKPFQQKVFYHVQ